MFKKYKERKNARVSAERWHDRGYAVAYEQGRTGNYDAEPVRFYEKAGKEWELAGEPTRASEDYLAALQAARKANKKKPGTISREKIGELEKWVPKNMGPAWAVLTISSALVGLSLVSSSITGNAIVNLTNVTSSFLGAGLLILGILGGFFWVNNRKK